MFHSITSDARGKGLHICQIYSDEDERNDSLLQFLLEGFQAGERAACFSEKTDRPMIEAFLAGRHMAFPADEAFTLSGNGEVYFQDNEFDPARILEMLGRFHEEALQRGFAGARVIGEMPPEIQSRKGGERLIEYECSISMLMKKHPLAAVCQYDANAFDGATIMDILKVHSHMIVRGEVVHNPFFIPPEQFLAK